MAEHASISRYLDELAHVPPEVSELEPPSPQLRASVVIPAYDELDRIASVVQSLDANALSPDGAEIIVVVNNSETADRSVVDRNIATLELLDRLETRFPIHPIDRCRPERAFPESRSGVGWARRIGMDLALARLADVGAPRGGLIPCLDGDSPASDAYLDTLLATFEDDDALAGVCPYRHPIPEDPGHARAIVAYESWMRYFAAGLHHTTTPYAYQSIGSCMVLTGIGYALADGVPTREALSDFYLLQKITKIRGRRTVRCLREPLVFPSARPSPRVPRGTGPSVRQTMEDSGDRFELVEPPATFAHLRRWLTSLREGFDDPDSLRDRAPGPLESFLSQHDGWETLEKLRRHAPDPDHFAAQVHQWFDSLKIVKYANERRRQSGGLWLFDALRRLLEEAGHETLSDEVPRSERRASTLEQRRRTLEILRRHEFDLIP